MVCSVQSGFFVFASEIKKIIKSNRVKDGVIVCKIGNRVRDARIFLLKIYYSRGCVPLSLVFGCGKLILTELNHFFYSFCLTSIVNLQLTKPLIVNRRCIQTADVLLYLWSQ